MRLAALLGGDDGRAHGAVAPGSEVIVCEECRALLDVELLNNAHSGSVLSSTRQLCMHKPHVLISKRSCASTHARASSRLHQVRHRQQMPQVQPVQRRPSCACADVMWRQTHHVAAVQSNREELVCLRGRHRHHPAALLCARVDRFLNRARLPTEPGTRSEDKTHAGGCCCCTRTSSVLPSPTAPYFVTSQRPAPISTVTYLC